MVLQRLLTIWWSLCKVIPILILRIKSLKMEPVNGLVIYKNFTCPQRTFPVCEDTGYREHLNEGLLACGLHVYHCWAAWIKHPLLLPEGAQIMGRSHCQNVVVSKPCSLNLIIEARFLSMTTVFPQMEEVHLMHPSDSTGIRSRAFRIIWSFLWLQNHSVYTVKGPDACQASSSLLICHIGFKFSLQYFHLPLLLHNKDINKNVILLLSHHIRFLPDKLGFSFTIFMF